MIIDTKEIDQVIKDIRTIEQLKHKQYIKNIGEHKDYIYLYLSGAKMYIKLDKETLLQQLKENEILE